MRCAVFKALLNRQSWFNQLALVAGRPGPRKGEKHGQRKTCASVEAHCRDPAKRSHLVCLYRGTQKAVSPEIFPVLLTVALELESEVRFIAPRRPVIELFVAGLVSAWRRGRNALRATPGKSTDLDSKPAPLVCVPL